MAEPNPSSSKNPKANINSSAALKRTLKQQYNGLNSGGMKSAHNCVSVGLEEIEFLQHLNNQVLRCFSLTGLRHVLNFEACAYSLSNNRKTTFCFAKPMI